MAPMTLKRQERTVVHVLLLLAAVALCAVSSLHLLRESSSGCSGGGGGGNDGAAAGRPLPAVERWEPCERAQLNETILQEWGCRVFHKTCFDQAHMLLHSGEKTPGHPNYTQGVLFEVLSKTAYILPTDPGEPTGQAHHDPGQFMLDIRGPTAYDPPDVWQPKEFSSCAVPLVFWPPYFSIFADLFMGTASTLSMMQAEGAFDRNVLLAAVTLGMEPLPFYQLQLDAFTRHKVWSLEALSSRVHMHTGQTRCWERSILCNLPGLYVNAPRHNHLELRPKTTGREIVAHYRRRFPQRVRPHEERVKREGSAVFRIAFMPRVKSRAILNLQQVLEACRAWAPPTGSPFRSVDCMLLPDGTADNFPDLLAQVQGVHALVNTHGSGNTYAYFLPPGSALIEIVPWNLHSLEWPSPCPDFVDYYFKDVFHKDQSVRTGYFRLVADRDHVSPGWFEKHGIGLDFAHRRDQDVRLDFPTLARALEKVALGELESVPGTFEQRVFHMTQTLDCKDYDPAAVAAAKAATAATEAEAAAAADAG